VEKEYDTFVDCRNDSVLDLVSFCDGLNGVFADPKHIFSTGKAVTNCHTHGVNASSGNSSCS
jgi:hypothetical protein